MRLRLCRTGGLGLAAGLTVLAAAGLAPADRASTNMDPAWMYQKAGDFPKATMYYHRTLRGLREVYLLFHWDNDPAGNAPGKYATEYPQILGEMSTRFETCLAAAKLGDDARRRMEFLDYLWLSELIDQEDGGLRTACGIIASACEDHGDFRMGCHLRGGEVRFCRVVAAPFHARSAKELEAWGMSDLAGASRLAAAAYEARAQRAERLARGGAVLRTLSGLNGFDRYLMDIRFHPKKPSPVSFQGLHLRLFAKDGTPKGPPRADVVAALRREGMAHADEDARFTALSVLARLDEREAVKAALADASPVIRKAAAEALAAMRWAEGWAACQAHTDAAVRAAVAPRLAPAGKDPLAATFVISELIGGMGSESTPTRAFCQSALEKVTGRRMLPEQWAAWWKTLGDARCGLKRKGPDGSDQIDETIDFGVWWQSLYMLAPNPLTEYTPPTTVRWEGRLVVPRAGPYRFYARNCGEAKTGRNSVKTPGRMGFPGLYLSGPSARVSVDGKGVLPQKQDVVQDPWGGMRLDFSGPVQLTEGLHPIVVEFDYRSAIKGFLLRTQPCLRLYWSAEGRPREVIPAEFFVTKE